MAASSFVCSENAAISEDDGQQEEGQESLDNDNEDSETNQCEAFSASVFTSVNNSLCCGEKGDKPQWRLDDDDDDVDEHVDWWPVICVCEGCMQLDGNQRYLNVSAGFVSFAWCWRLKTDFSIIRFLL